METPWDESDLARVLSSAAQLRRTVRPLGSGHSFTPLGVTDGVSLRMDHFTGITKVDRESGEVTFRAGTPLHRIAGLLEPHGLALANMGDIDRQTLAGAVSTGTHGTGLAFTGFAGMVSAFTLMLADGSIKTCSPTENPELFQAARISLGAFGVLLDVTVRCVPAFLLRANEYPDDLATVLDSWPELTASADHVEFYWFPHTSRALVKRNCRLPADAARQPLSRSQSMIDDELVSNALFEGLNRVMTWAPGLTPRINRIAARVVADRTYADASHQVFVSPRRVRFREMEYAIARDQLPAVLREIQELIERRGWRISFPLEVRVAAADDVWLSTAYQRPTAYVAVHAYHRHAFVDYFRGVQDIFRAADGRPHWGKMHTLGAADFAALYPKFAAAQDIRQTVDPGGLFASPYLQGVLG